MSCRTGWACAPTVIVAALLTVGCTTRRGGETIASATKPSGAAAVTARTKVTDSAAGTAPQHQSGSSSEQVIPGAISPVTFQAPTSSESIAVEPLASEPIAAASESLDLASYVNEVLTRNRSLQAMISAWRAAAQKYPQAVALDDPMFTAMTAPASWSSNDVTPAYLLGASQKIPWWGKRSLRGQVVQAEASAASLDVADARLQLTQAA